MTPDDTDDRIPTYAELLYNQKIAQWLEQAVHLTDFDSTTASQTLQQWLDGDIT